MNGVGKQSNFGFDMAGERGGVAYNTQQSRDLRDSNDLYDSNHASQSDVVTQ